MKKLWIFGDSYGYLDQDSYERSKDWHWISLLANELTDNKFITLSHHGAANEWIYYQFTQHLENITENDYVVFITTQYDRKWFFPENIGSSNLNIIFNYDSTDQLTRDQKNAVKQYLLHLKNPIVDPLNFEMLCCAIHYHVFTRKLNLILLPGFEEQGFSLSGKYLVKGSLYDLCRNEIRGKTHQDWLRFMLTKNEGVDPRLGHLSEINHLVLAEKIKNTFLKNDLLDLTTGFHEEIID